MLYKKTIKYKIIPITPNSTTNLLKLFVPSFKLNVSKLGISILFFSLYIILSLLKVPIPVPKIFILKLSNEKLRNL